MKTIRTLVLAIVALAVAMPVAAQPARLYDQEVVTPTAAIGQSSKQLANAVESALKRDKTTPESARKAMVADVKKVGEDAKVLGSAVKDGKPASAHVTALVDQVKKVQGAIAASSAANTLMSQVGERPASPDEHPRVAEEPHPRAVLPPPVRVP